MLTATPMSSLTDARIVVTGGSRGIGLGIAEVLVAAGGRVLIAGRDVDALRVAADHLAPFGRHSIRTCRADVSDASSCTELAKAAAAELGGVDVLCCNAGIFPSAPLINMTEADLDRVLRVNFYGTVFCVQAFQQILAASGRGRIVITSSITGPITGYPGWAHYGASKAAQLGFMRTAAIELAASGTTINAVLPGNVATEGLTDLGADYLATMAASVPLGRLGTPADIGHAVAFLASEEAGYITGQTLVVDGGQTLPESLDALGREQNA